MGATRGPSNRSLPSLLFPSSGLKTSGTSSSRNLSDTFELRQVGRGRDLEGEIEIVSGLKSGETVVVDGAFLLKAEAEKARGEGKEHDHD